MTQDQIDLLNILKQTKQTKPDWYKWRLTNNYERAAFIKGDVVHAREASRYQWAAQHILGKKILDIGCSNGYGSQFFPQDIEYTGLDYDPVIIEIAWQEQWGDTRQFIAGDINKINLGQYDTIIAFEVIEHLDNGLEIVEKLKQHCKRLLISVPYKEPKGFWGEHHKLHDLSHEDFPDFEPQFIDADGYVLNYPNPNTFNLMLLRWDNV